jgi:hypothetical protein
MQVGILYKNILICLFDLLNSPSDNVIEEQSNEAYDRQPTMKQGPQNKLEPLNSKEPKKEVRKETPPFFRIWYGLRKDDIAKILLGSSAAAISGISKPLFGYFIMTIGVAYYETNATKKVGQYSLIFFGAGMITLASSILQHYIYGVIGEKAMINLREALFSCMPYENFLHSFCQYLARVFIVHNMTSFYLNIMQLFSGMNLVGLKSQKMA